MKIRTRNGDEHTLMEAFTHEYGNAGDGVELVLIRLIELVITRGPAQQHAIRHLLPSLDVTSVVMDA